MIIDVDDHDGDDGFRSGADGSDNDEAVSLAQIITAKCICKRIFQR